MKKVLLIILIVFTFTFMGCSSDYLDKEVTETTNINVLQAKYEALLNKKEELENDIIRLKNLSSEYEFLITELEEKLVLVEEELQQAFEKLDLINKQIIKGTVLVSQVSFNTEDWWFIHNKVDGLSTFGSGFIFKYQDGYYYLLTNNHVIEVLENREDNEIYIKDYQGDQYDATIVCASSYYDMAVLKFKSSKSYYICKFANEDAVVGDDVFVFGNPKGQFQSVSTGKVKCYRYVTTTSGFKTNYECVETTAFTLGGSSGGLISNTDFEIIGITTYGAATISYVTYDNLGSPVSKIKEFLSKNNISIG